MTTALSNDKALGRDPELEERADTPATLSRLEEALAHLGSGDTPHASGPVAVPSHENLLQPEDRARLPPTPTDLDLKTARIPPLPMVQEDWDAEYRFEELVGWWVSMSRRRYGMKCGSSFAFAKELKLLQTNPAKAAASKKYQLLVQAAETMRQRQVSPPTWIDFSFDQWEFGRARAGGKRLPETPPIGVVFSSARMVKWSGWHRKFTPIGGRRLPGPTELEVFRRYSAMEETLRRIPRLEREARTAEVLATYFPGDSFTQMIRKARTENETMQEVLDKMVRTRKWVWDSQMQRDGATRFGKAS